MRLHPVAIWRNWRRQRALQRSDRVRELALRLLCERHARLAWLKDLPVTSLEISEDDADMIQRSSRMEKTTKVAVAYCYVTVFGTVPLEVVGAERPRA